MPHLQTGVLEPESSTELWEFVNPNFLRDQPELLPLVQRKKTQSGADGASTSTGLVSTHDIANQQPHASGSKSGANHAGPSHSLDLQAVVSAVAQVRNQQSSLSQELKDLQTSNAHLWQEALASRERHKRHQETTDRILRFLAGVFGAGAAGDMAEGSGSAESPASDAGGPDTGKGKGKGKAKRGVAVVPKDRARLMIGDGRIGLAEEDQANAAGLEEIELPYADGENEQMEEISSSRFNDFSPTLNSTPQYSHPPPTRPNFNTRASTSSIRNLDSPPEQRFKSLSPSDNQPTPSSSSNRQNSLALSFSNSPRTHHATPQSHQAPHQQTISEEQPPSPQPLSPFSQWMNLDQGTYQSAQSLLSSLSDPNALSSQPNGSSSNNHVAGLLSDSAYNHPSDPFSFPSPLGAPAQPIPSKPSAYPLSPSTLAALSSTIRNDAAAVSPTPSQLGRSYASAEAIAAEVDALQTSISALVASLGLDANAEAQLRGELIDGPAMAGGAGAGGQDLFNGGAGAGEFDMSAFFVPEGNADGSAEGLVNGLGGGDPEAIGDLAEVGSEDFDRMMEGPMGGAGGGWDASGLAGGGVPRGTRGKKRKSEGMGDDGRESDEEEDEDEEEEDGWDGRANGDGDWEPSSRAVGGAGARKKR